MAERKTDQHDDQGFLSRWSQRKQAVRTGQPVQESVEQPVELIREEKRPLVGKESSVLATNTIANEAAQDSVTVAQNKEPEPPPPPTLQDAQQLTPESDFKPFMRADVQPEVKNAAMKQLFKDPHFNTMDMMDVYVDDYSKPDPLPPEMLRKMAVTQFLGFWKEEEEEAKKQAEKKQAEKKEAQEKKIAQAREDAKPEHSQSVAQSSTTEISESSQEAAPVAQPSSQDHDDTDLRLQPDDAARRESDRQRAG
jgi:hypothetical protein